MGVVHAFSRMRSFNLSGIFKPVAIIM